MYLDELVQKIEKARISIDDTPFNQVNPSNRYNTAEVKGRIAETMVKRWLENCPSISFDQNLPRRVNGYNLTQTNGGVLVCEGTRHVCEFDFLVLYENKPTLVEVKSLKLKGIEYKIPRILRVGREIYEGHNIGMLLFFPFYANKQKEAQRITERFDNLRCINLGYKKKQLNSATTVFKQRY